MDIIITCVICATVIFCVVSLCTTLEKIFIRQVPVVEQTQQEEEEKQAEDLLVSSMEEINGLFGGVDNADN